MTQILLGCASEYSSHIHLCPDPPDIKVLRKYDGCFRRQSDFNPREFKISTIS
jgi:hypothetical protein